MIKWLRQSNSPMRRRFTLHIIWVHFQVVFFADIINFRECATIKAVMKKYSSYIFLLNQGRSTFLNGTRLQGKTPHSVLLFILVSYSSNSCYAT